jgi:hypothetical protein
MTIDRKLTSLSRRIIAIAVPLWLAVKKKIKSSYINAIRRLKKSRKQLTQPPFRPNSHLWASIPRPKTTTDGYYPHRYNTIRHRYPYVAVSYMGAYPTPVF